jgi:hypothetical protein
MKAVDILAAIIRVRHGDDVTLFTVLVLESPAGFVVYPPELHKLCFVKKEKNQHFF